MGFLPRIVVLSNFFLILVHFNAYSYPLVPDEKITTGALCDPSDNDFDDYRYPEKIAHCKRDVSSSLKRKVYELYNISKECRKRYTVDHFIPLSIGGDNSLENLWPEHVLVKETRPDFEQSIFESVATGEISQQEAIELVIEEKTENVRKFFRSDFEENCDQ